ncbi:MAG: hypothetical protein CML13_14550 [Puniceicoccaceae bacterium]|nr:hypothetical protein [Puniceicoccaceae bacterium]|tara:strand:+ start:23623 stop:25350 length:1728 start_codon:yes stop_codon:yes gene_type:complete
MNASLRFYCFGLLLLARLLSGQVVYPGIDETWPFAPAAGQAGSTAIAMDDSSIVAWASGFENLSYGSAVSDQWKTPVKALGPAVGDSFDVVSLGQGGQITLTFTHPIQNGDGPDFVVFENSFSDTFLELAWVEVSTDGQHFVRFPNYSYREAGAATTADLFHGYAGKYRQGYGTPFDLDQLRYAYEALEEEDPNAPYFSTEFRTQLALNYPTLDLADIRYVRLVDIVGDGTALDANGYSIWDPYPTSGSAGLDLDAIGVLHQVEPSGLAQSIAFDSIANRPLLDGDLILTATASSGLPVTFEVIDGAATVTDDVLSFSGLGQVVVKAIQAGDGDYAVATPVVRSFYVADALQHIYFEPVANQLPNTSVPLHASTSSGLTPLIEVVSGPSDVSTGFPPNQELSSGATTGSVQLRAYQSGGTLEGVTYAPAEDVLLSFEIVASSDPAAPLSFAAWQGRHSLSAGNAADSDSDGASDFEEYASGSDPNDPNDRPVRTLNRTEAGAYLLGMSVNTAAPIRLLLEGSQDLSDAEAWMTVVPEVISDRLSLAAEGQRDLVFKLTPTGSVGEFWRIQFEAND